MTKSFRIKNSDKQPIEFNLDFELPDSDEVKTETFRVRPRVPGSVLLDVVAAGTLDSSYQAAAIRKFFHVALLDEDRERFFKTIEESDPPVEMTDLSDIINYLMGEYGQKSPTGAGQS